jgi:hypothetical protein
MTWSPVDRVTVLVPRVSAQRCVLIAIAVLAATAASASTVLAAAQPNGIVMVIVVVLAIPGAMFPDTFTATAVEIVVVLQWWASTGGGTTAWSIVTALCLFVFHAVIALMALTSFTASVARSILVRWARRSAWVVLATVAMWLLVRGMAERRAGGNPSLTVVGFLTLAALVMSSRSWRPTKDDDPGS